MGGELSTHRREVNLTRPSQENMKERKYSECTHVDTHKIPLIIGENHKIYYSATVWIWSENNLFSAEISTRPHHVRG